MDIKLTTSSRNAILDAVILIASFVPPPTTVCAAIRDSTTMKILYFVQKISVPSITVLCAPLPLPARLVVISLLFLQIKKLVFKTVRLLYLSAQSVKLTPLVRVVWLAIRLMTMLLSVFVSAASPIVPLVSTSRPVSSARKVISQTMMEPAAFSTAVSSTASNATQLQPVVNANLPSRLILARPNALKHVL